jgi:hypothetical protein
MHAKNATNDWTLQYRDCGVGDLSLGNAVEDLYERRHDVILVRNAFPNALLAEVVRRLEDQDRQSLWTRPSKKVENEDVLVLGANRTASRTYAEPNGPPLQAYLESAARDRAVLEEMFAGVLEPVPEMQRLLARFAGGRPVEVATSEGERFVPMTVRCLTDGKSLVAHHDDLYRLPVYKKLAPTLDRSALISFVVTLQRPSAGGALVVYPVPPNAPGPKLPDGFFFDVEAIEQRKSFVRVDPNAGDLFLLASDRCLHRVEPAAGTRSRITMGGFLAFDANRSRVVFWN